MVSHKIYSRIVCLYCFLLISSQLTRAKTADDPGIVRQRMGVVLTTGAGTPNDYTVLAPVIDLAVRDVKRDFNFENWTVSQFVPRRLRGGLDGGPE